MLKVFPVSKYLLLLTVLAIGRCNPDAKEISYKQGISVKQNLISYKVIRVKDGDTFVLLMDGKEQAVRLAHVDCPEKRQPFGNNAKQFVSDRCFDKYVTVIHADKYDRNRRLIAEVILASGENLNKELVKNGLAWHFKKYSDSREYAALETEARRRKKGLWADETPIAPWNWRHRKSRYKKCITRSKQNVYKPLAFSKNTFFNLREFFFVLRVPVFFCLGSLLF